MNNEVNLFILIPESNPKFHWINNLDNLVDEENAILYLKNLELFKSSIDSENYNGYYDVNSFLELVNHFEIIDDYFPNPIKRRLISLYSDFYDWRKSEQQSNENLYEVFNQNIENHTLCEISQRKHITSNENFSLLNNFAITFDFQMEITINHSDNYTFEILSNELQLTNWFSENRIPQRRFQAIPKHNIPKPIRINNEWHYPLYKSEVDPAEVLKTAIGLTKKELFGYDSYKDMFLVFKYENVPHENQYHAYHVELKSEEVPNKIGKKLKPIK